MKPRTSLLFILTCLLVAPAAGAFRSSPTGLLAKTAAAVDGDALPEGLQVDDWASIRAAYEAERHAFFPTDLGYQTRSHGNGWLARFEGQGVTLEPNVEDWSFEMELERYGFLGALVTVDRAREVRAEGQRLTYDWGAGLSEWWKSDTRGLEHGFTVQERPQCTSEGGDGPLVFDVTVRGDLRPSLMASGRGLRFVNSEDAVVLTYDGLVAFDADGSPIEAWLETTETGMRIVVLEENARYPLTVDPVIQTAYLKASNTDALDGFGGLIAVSGDTVVVAAPGEDSSSTGVNGNQSDNSASQSGAAYVFVRTGSSWSQQAYLKASNTDEDDRFGSWIEISGDTVVVGASEEASSATGVNGNQSDNSASQSGAAYVFVRTGSSWSQQAYLKASNTDEGDRFGSSIAISGDTVVVGAAGERSSATGVNGNQSDNNAFLAGAAYVFSRTGSSWSQQAYLKASNTDSGDGFGGSVSVSDETAVIGAGGESSSATGVNGNQSDNSLGFAPPGAAYVFVRTGSTWSQQAYLKASNTNTNDAFGSSIAISGDTAVVGAPFEASSATGVNGNQTDNAAASGAAYVFVRTGNTWNQQAYLKASNTDAGDFFGIVVAVSEDTVVVGARSEDSSAAGINGNQADNSALSAGAAYVFIRTGSSWSQQGYLKASNTEEGDLFGGSVGVSGDTVVVGAFREASSAIGVNGNQSDNGAIRAGAAYVFDLSALGTIGSDLCQPALANSTGVPGNLVALGSEVAADNTVTFFATELPLNQLGFLVNSMSTQMIPVSDGILCIGPDIGRHNAQADNSGMTGAISTTVDLANLPRPGGTESVMAGQTWYFQFWHRDGPGASNFTNGIEILFQ